MLAVETRGGMPEVFHLGHAVLLRPDGTVERSWGDPLAPTFWRSSAKPLQAVPFARHRKRLGLTSAAVAVACASHTGEGHHLEAAQAILDAIGLGEESLLCGTHGPWGKHSVFTANDARPLHNNCSGCHAGMLAACVAEGWDTATYFRLDHPLQRQLLALAEEASGFRPDVAIDGCGAPTYRTPLVGLARAFQWLHRSEPAVLDAMAEHPRLIGGTDEFDTDLLQATRGRVVGKYGALAVYGAVDRRTGAAVAVRVTTANEAVCDAVAGRIMLAAGLLGDAASDPAVTRHLELPVLNALGTAVGETEFRVP